MGKALDGSVIEVDVSHIHGFTRPFERLGIHRVSVVLRANGDLARGKILTRLIATMVAEF